MKGKIIFKCLLATLTYPLWFIFTAILSGLYDMHYFSDTIIGYIVVNMQWLLIGLFIAFIIIVQYFIYKLKPIEKSFEKKIYLNVCIVLDCFGFIRHIILPVIISNIL